MGEWIDTQEYGSVSYWERRYTACPAEQLDWYVSYNKIKAHLTFLTPDHQILIIGCGTSPFSIDLAAAGYPHLINIDAANGCVVHMQRRAPHLRWQVMDATQMGFEDAAFDVIVDKGTTDAIEYAAHSDTLLPQLHAHIRRCLRPGGRYVCITHGGLLGHLTYAFKQEGWHITETEVEGISGEHAATYVLLVMTKPSL
eukprot:NODE_4834_length_734_cov_27.601318_g4672_i0.p1 GENE.NODE_4834_length_734_cov_27.601318_g4672_i0~~NODE_4834_length_734_cov_27.601318_g4672_i0.p1  ORF type:complete len:198 (-),score=50.57 NODE_4834_length_734_cov_27.601318_g4672_i0:62-655(-)